MILTTTTQKLQVFLAGAKATNDCPVTVDYVDFTTTDTTPGVSATNTNGTTTTDILAAPAASTQRKINGLTLYNADTSPIVVTIQINDNSTLYPVISAVTLQPKMTLQYTDRRGWFTTNGSGAALQSLRTGMKTVFLANGTWTKPANARFVLVECVGGGGVGGDGGGAGGGGKRSRWLFLAKDLPATVSVTVGAATTAATGGADGATGNTSNFGTYLYAYGGGKGTVPVYACCVLVAPAYGGYGAGGTSSGGAAFVAAPAVNTSVATHQGGGRSDAGTPGGSFLGGGGGAIAGYSGGYSWFSAGGGGGNYVSSPATASLGGGAGASAYGGGTRSLGGSPGAPGFTDIMGCGTGGGGGSVAAGGAGGFPGGGGGAGAGSIGAAGVVRVWCW